MLINIFSNAIQSVKIDEHSSLERKFVARKRLIQYFVSEVSFNAIFIINVQLSIIHSTSPRPRDDFKIIAEKRIHVKINENLRNSRKAHYTML